jgi:hypothetical protein
MSFDLVLEERYSAVREGIFRILSASSDYSAEVAAAFVEVFAPIVDDADHGPIFWAIMVKTQVHNHPRLGEAHLCLVHACASFQQPFLTFFLRL